MRKGHSVSCGHKATKLPEFKLTNIVFLKSEVLAVGRHSPAHLSLMMGRNFEESISHAEAVLRLKARNPQYRLALVGLL